MSKTQNQTFTQLPPSRIIKNRDLRTPIGERDKYNIGFGMPRWNIVNELPDASISKFGDTAYVLDTDALMLYTQDGWIPVKDALTDNAGCVGFFQLPANQSTMNLTVGVYQELVWAYVVDPATPQLMGEVGQVEGNVDQIDATPTCNVKLGVFPLPFTAAQTQCNLELNFYTTNQAGNEYALILEYADGSTLVYQTFCAPARFSTSAENRSINVTVGGFKELPYVENGYAIRARIATLTDGGAANNIVITSINFSLNVIGTRQLI